MTPDDPMSDIDAMIFYTALSFALGAAAILILLISILR